MEVSKTASIGSQKAIFFFLSPSALCFLSKQLYCVVTYSSRFIKSRSKRGSLESAALLRREVAFLSQFQTNYLFDVRPSAAISSH